MYSLDTAVRASDQLKHVLFRLGYIEFVKYLGRETQAYLENDARRAPDYFRRLIGNYRSSLECYHSSQMTSINP